MLEPLKSHGQPEFLGTTDGTTNEAILKQWENNFQAQRAARGSGEWEIPVVIKDESIAAAQDRAQAWLEIGWGYILEGMAENRQSGVRIETKYVDRDGNIYEPRVTSANGFSDDEMGSEDELREELEHLEEVDVNFEVLDEAGFV